MNTTLKSEEQNTVGKPVRSGSEAGRSELPEPFQHFLLYGSWTPDVSAGFACANEKEYDRLCKRLVTRLNSIRRLTDQERKRDTLFGFVVAGLVILIPMIGVPILAALHHPLAAVILFVCSAGSGLAIGLVRRRRFLRNYYQVKDAHTLVEVLNWTDELERLSTVKPALLFNAPPEPQLLDLFYNWLYRRKLIEVGERLKVWQVTGEQLTAYTGDQAFSGSKLLLVPVGERVPNDPELFKREAVILKVLVLSGPSAAKGEN